MFRSNSVIAVGIDIGIRLPKLLSELTTQGFHLVEASGPEGLAAALEDAPGATVVVYNRPEENTARRALRVVTRLRRKVPVIILVERSDFSEYYELMCEGAFDYFDVTEDPRWIERAVQSAAHLQAA